MGDDLDQTAAIAAAAGRISELIRSCDTATPVPHLGRWTIRDVAAHLGGVHRWATRIITTRSMDGPGFRKSRLDGTELVDWFDVGAADLVDTLGSNASDEHCPNFNPGSPKTVRWWSRRQMHETLVHRWDIEQALTATTPIPRDIAVDGIDEYLDTFVRTRGSQTLVAPLRIATKRPARSWTLTPADRPGRIDITTDRASSTDAAITGDAEQMLLFLWGRRHLAETTLTVIGNNDTASSLKPQH